MAQYADTYMHQALMIPPPPTPTKSSTIIIIKWQQLECGLSIPLTTNIPDLLW